MQGNHYSSISVSGPGTTVLGNVYEQYTLQYPSDIPAQLDIPRLLSQLQETSEQCEHLRTTLVEDTSLSFVKSLEQDVEDIQSMIQTIKMHLEEDDAADLDQPWLTPLRTLSAAMHHHIHNLDDVRSDLKIAAAMSEDIEAGKTESSGQLNDIVITIRTKLQNLRLKLSVSTALLHFNAFKTSQTMQTEHMDNLHSKLSTLLEQLENEKVARLPDADSLREGRLSDVDSDRGYTMRRFQALSLEGDLRSLRSVSMQVSSFMADPPDDAVGSQHPVTERPGWLVQLENQISSLTYSGLSLDMALRKTLMSVDLPNKTRDIDRIVQIFANRYHECNPDVFMNADEAYFVTFSILILASDTHNKNNRRKLTKQDYIKNTLGAQLSVTEGILECFYDNICYTPFVRFEEELTTNDFRLPALKPKKSTTKDPVDPYELILHNRLDALRMPLEDVLHIEDPYSVSQTFDLGRLAANHRAFVWSAVLQIVSQRSREYDASTPLFGEALTGLVNVKVAKVGLLWRKSTKKKTARSPWQEWGVILTPSSLYFFKNFHWVRNLISQSRSQEAELQTTSTLPFTFQPPLTSFTPDDLVSMDDSVALIDSSYKRHKHAFTLSTKRGYEEVVLANTDADREDWINKLNYAATFRTAGVRMRNVLVPGPPETPTGNANQTSQPAGNDRIPSDMVPEIMAYRRQLMREKIKTFDAHVSAMQKELDHLLRNARHLTMMLPIQQRTREGLVYAAGRMDAKLKWTRLAIWRVRTHRDILNKDLEAEAISLSSAPTSDSSPAVSSNNMNVTPTQTSDSLVRTDIDKVLTATASSTSIPQSSEQLSSVDLTQTQTDNTSPAENMAGRHTSPMSAELSSLHLTSNADDDWYSVRTSRTKATESHSLDVKTFEGDLIHHGGTNPTEPEPAKQLVPEAQHT